MDDLLKQLLEKLDEDVDNLNQYEEGQRDLLIAITGGDIDAINEILDEYK